MSCVFFAIWYIFGTFLVCFALLNKDASDVFGGKDNRKNNTKCRHFGFFVKRCEQHYDK